MDELVKYEFMEELQQELFDGSTKGRTLEDSGIDFNQRLNIFQGRNRDYTVSGVTFGISNETQLFEVFDDYQPTSSNIPDIRLYSSYFNRIAIRGKSAILLRVSPSMELVDKVTDSIWYGRGNDYPWYNEDMYELLESEGVELEKDEEAVEFPGDMEIEENTTNPEEESGYPIADENPNEKTYYELRDSVEAKMQMDCFEKVSRELFVSGKNLMTRDAQFAQQLSHNSEGAFYLDNSRNLNRSNAFWSLRHLYPGMIRDIEKLYEGNVILGDLIIRDNAIDLQLNINYGEQLGSIYSEMTDTKFDKNVLKYIHKDNSAFFTYNIDLRKAYEQTYDVVVPILSKAGKQMSASLLALELIDEFVNKDAVFDLYQGSMFGTYNGIKKIKTKKIIFEYDEETFDYTEKEVEAEEDMPIFTMGFTTRRNDIPERILMRMSRIFPDIVNKGDYWEVNDAILKSAPLFFILKNDLFIFTNDEDLAKNYNDGYGKDAIPKKEAKRARKSGVMYAYADMGKAIESVPRDLFNDQENELIDVIRGKSGTMEIISTATTNESTDMKFSYNFAGEPESVSKYILDLINSLYVISK